ncbi:hypothetical protein IQ230_23480 [Gloeocapsopsis crepidinum LEGE 06123]|uniref:Uncharacterized protein n=1 Tax=Gloeocapsopsis crepidinum LEGE 06123 TaxID=588587 RepID=A0ABR9UY89_9CHRO|nr:hypothetical protein [Gloeocapsopsis crepidinum]MBE9193252.1 hypothetical protein [Gloeocapsopsis crepidinum LEGE 06123]
MQTPGQSLFSAILKVAKSKLKPQYSDIGVKVQWDLDNLELRGTFAIPLKTEINVDTGEYIVTSQDFTESSVNPEP